MARLVGIADEIAEAGAKELEKSLIDNLSKKSGVTSNPGEYPAKQSGELVRSVRRRRRRVGSKVEHSVSVEASHAEIVEKNRPFFDRTIKENRERIQSAMARAAQRKGLKSQ